MASASGEMNMDATIQYGGMVGQITNHQIQRMMLFAHTERGDSDGIYNNDNTNNLLRSQTSVRHLSADKLPMSDDSEHIQGDVGNVRYWRGSERSER